MIDCVESRQKSTVVFKRVEVIHIAGVIAITCNQPVGLVEFIKVNICRWIRSR